jgi:hypothetical protein
MEKNLLGVGEKTTRKKNYDQMTTLTLTSPQLNMEMIFHEFSHA